MLKKITVSEIDDALTIFATTHNQSFRNILSSVGTGDIPESEGLLSLRRMLETFLDSLEFDHTCLASQAAAERLGRHVCETLGPIPRNPVTEFVLTSTIDGDQDVSEPIGRYKDPIGRAVFTFLRLTLISKPDPADVKAEAVRAGSKRMLSYIKDHTKILRDAPPII